MTLEYTTINGKNLPVQLTVSHSSKTKECFKAVFLQAECPSCAQPTAQNTEGMTHTHINRQTDGNAVAYTSATIVWEENETWSAFGKIIG